MSTFLSLLLAFAVPLVPQSIERKTAIAPDGVQIVYSAAGSGETALVFIHGGMADRTFYDAQLKHFGGRYRVIALDLAGHGESGANRKVWGIREFGGDVRAVADAEQLKRIVLFGNSLGGPVAVEAALLMPGRAIGVVGIDTFQDLAAPWTPQRAEMFEKTAAAFKADYPGTVKAMVKSLLHADADPAFVASTEQRMLKTSATVAYSMVMSLAKYNIAASAEKLTAPLRTINGDLYPTDLPAIRRVKPDFDAIIMPRTGHYPMLEKPAEFNKHIETLLAQLVKH
jgi:pimeloyl-ACP methyl ester carboxylesterase